MMTWINQLSVFAADMAPFAVSFLWQSTLFILFGGIISIMLRKRGPVIRLSLWIAVMVIIPLIPFTMQIAQYGNVPTAPLTVLPSALYELNVSSSSPETGSPLDTLPAATASKSQSKSANPYLFGLLIYALGAGIFLTGIVFATIRIRLWERTGKQLAGGRIVDIVNEYCGLFGIKRDVRIIEHSKVTVPCTAGILRPVIFVPESYESMLSEEQITSVLCHECAHIKRHDVSILAATSIIRALIWIQPFVWIIQKHIAILAEQSADELVLGTGTNPSSYASTLTNIVQNHALQHSRVLSPVGFIDFRHTFLYRVRAILKYTKVDTMTWRGYALLAVSLFIMVSAVTAVPLTERDVAADNKTDEKETLNLVLKDAESKEPISGVEMSVWYFNLDKMNEETNNYSYLVVESVSDQNGRISFEGLENLDPSITQIIISRDNDSEYPRCAIVPNILLFKKILSFGRQYDRSLNLDRTKVKSDNTYTVYMEPPAVIRGTVVDPYGNPVAGATVDVIPANPKGSGGNSLTGDCRYRVMTDNLGRYSIGLPNEDRDVRLIAHDGDLNEWRTWANGQTGSISLKRHKSAENVTIRLARPSTISGVVRDPDGNPVADAGVIVKYPYGRYNRYYRSETKTDENGRFTLSHVRAGDLLVLCDRDYVNTYHPEKCEWPEGYLVPVNLSEGQNISNVDVLGLTFDEVSKIERNNYEKSRKGLWFAGIGFKKLW
ncbi:M56 family metallopeptidase [Candidatus Latescibacterota bacterium]